MKQLVFSLMVILLFDTFLNSCANPGTISGGPKDTIPPILVASGPTDQTLNFHGQSISLTFDEFVTADKLKQSLIITPLSDINFKVLYKKQTVILRFEELFEDSTTYTFNFFDGITDITERNPAENLILAFSTGNYIDSVRIFGNVKDLYSGKPIPKMTVGLFRLTDSLNLFSTKPTYFSATLADGSFLIQNIKNNTYKLLAFLDNNKNLLFDPGTETYAFRSDTLYLTESMSDSIRLKALSIDASILNLISARPSGQYFEVRYSKPITHYTVSHPAIDTTMLSDLTNESASIRFYNHLNLADTDSLQTLISVRDSLKTTRKDTVYIKFRTVTRKPTDFNQTLLPKSNTLIFENEPFQITFSKPAVLIDSNFLFVSLDTLYNIDIPAISPAFNFNQTALSFSLDPSFRQFYADTLQNLVSSIIIDTLNIDTPQLVIKRKLQMLPANRFVLNVRSGAFVSAESDTSKTFNASYSYGKPEDYGSLKLTILTDTVSFFVQVMNKDKVVRELKNCRNCTINLLPPGNYWLRILIDSDLDNTWSYGNFLNNIEPEPVLYFPEETSLRANWQVELNYSF